MIGNKDNPIPPNSNPEKKIDLIPHRNNKDIKTENNNNNKFKSVDVLKTKPPQLKPNSCTVKNNYPICTVERKPTQMETGNKNRKKS